MTISAIQRDEAAALPEQIRGIIYNRITDGTYQPGKRLNSIRDLAKEFSVSTVTVGKALDILEGEELINRVPIKGIFVSERLRPENRQLNACLAFPGTTFEPEQIGYESWGLSTELYRGLMAGASKFGVNLQFTYFQDKPDRQLLKRQLAEFKRFDFAIFPSSQLAELQTLAAKEQMVFRVAGYGDEEYPGKIIKVDYDRQTVMDQLVGHVVKCGCRSAGVIGRYSQATRYNRAEDFLNRCRESGISGWPSICPGEREKNEVQKLLLEFLSHDRPDFIFCDDTLRTGDVYEAALKLNLRIGTDFQMAGIASGLIFHGLIPQYTYFRIPRYEMGLKIISAAAEAIRQDRRILQVSLLNCELIQGQSTHLQEE